MNKEPIDNNSNPDRQFVDLNEGNDSNDSIEISEPGLTVAELQISLAAIRSELVNTKAELENIKIELKDKIAELEEAKNNIYNDPVAGCLNRAYFEYRKKHINPERDSGKIGLEFYDLNFLKFTNDTYGYGAGDNLLKDTVNYLSSNVRKGDEIVRIGGDEFIVICKNDNNDENFEKNLNDRAREIVNNSKASLAFGTAIYDKQKDEDPFSVEDPKKGLENTKERAGFSMQRDKRIMKMTSILKSVLFKKQEEL